MKGMRGALLALTVGSCGCGTVCNLASGSPDNYGGVQRDIKAVSDATEKDGLLSGSAHMSGGGWDGAVMAAVVLGLYPAEVGLSFVGDTATLPLVMYLRHRNDPASGDAGSGR